MRRTIGHALAALALVAFAAGTLTAQDAKERLAAAKQAAADNQARLRSYSWLEKTELSLKGEVKTTKIDSCRYGPDGRIQKTPVVQPPPPEKKRGLRGKIVAKKTGEMKEELQATGALIQQYIPPDPGLMQAVINAGTASLAQAGPDRLKLIFPGYVKSGDSLALTFDKSVKALHQIDVRTYVEDPAKPAALSVTMAALPDGTRFPGNIALSIPASKLEVRITRSNYQKLAP